MKELLRKLDELKQRAAAKLAEVKDETAPDLSRAIEADHAARAGVKQRFRVTAEAHSAIHVEAVFPRRNE